MRTTTTTGQSPRRRKRASSDRVCASDARVETNRERKRRRDNARDLPHGSKPRSPGMEPSNQAGRTAPGLQSYRFESNRAFPTSVTHTRRARPSISPRRVGFRVIAIARKNERCEETDARARVPSATENLSRATYLFLGAAHDLLRRRSLSRRRRLLRRGLLDRRLRRRSLRLEHDDRRESSWCAAPHLRGRVRPSVRLERPVRSIDGISRSVPMEYRWNAPIEVSVPIERPDRTPRSRSRSRSRPGPRSGGSVTHTTTSRDSSIDLDRGIPSGRSIWIGVIVRSFVRTDRGIPSIDRSISMAFVWITSTSRDSRQKNETDRRDPLRTTERASERRAGDARGRRESLGQSCRSCRSFVSFVSIVRVVRETRRGARGWLKCK